MSQKASKIAVEALVKAIHGGAAPSKTPLYSEADTETDFGWVTNFAGVDPQRTSDSQKLQTPKSAAQLAASSAEARSAEGPARRASMSAFVKHFLQP